MTLTVTRRMAARVGAVVAVTLGAAALAFVGGKATRLSDSEASSRKATAVGIAVRRERRVAAAAMVRQRTADKAQLAAAVKHQHKHDQNVLKRAMRKARKNAQQQAAAAANTAYSNGQSAGYSNGQSDGYSSGVDDGLVQGSDQLSCSDDPDVYWLPPCF